MAIGPMLRGIIGLLLGVAVALAVVAILAGPLGLLIPSNDEASLNNFKVLTARIDSMLESGETFACSFDQKQGPSPFYLADGVIMVGYNYDKDKQHTDCSNEFATKPKQLEGKAGLCLHKQDWGNNFDEDEQKPITCYKFKDKVVFLAPKDNSYYSGFGGSTSSEKHPLTPGESYEDVFLYGSECDPGEPDLGATRLYLEVYKKDGVDYVYINEHNPENEGQVEANAKRCEDLKKRLVPTL